MGKCFARRRVVPGSSCARSRTRYSPTAFASRSAARPTTINCLEPCPAWSARAMRRVLFLDRGGTLVVEPKGGPMDALDNLRLVPGVIPALLKFKTAGYQFVIATNQGGLGGPNFPRAAF